MCLRSILLNCQICLDSFNDKERKPFALVPCGHGFCKHCVSQLKEKLCPLCKAYFHSTITNWTIVNGLDQIPEENETLV